MSVQCGWWLCTVFKLCLKCELCAHNFSPYTEGRRTKLKYGEEEKGKCWARDLNGLLPCSACWMWWTQQEVGSADVVESDGPLMGLSLVGCELQPFCLQIRTWMCWGGIVLISLRHSLDPENSWRKLVMGRVWLYPSDVMVHSHLMLSQC
jgi:hypothetical protein